MQLVIAEKPSVARNIAKVLHATNVKDGYLEGKEYLVSWCIGHLIELASADQYRDDWKAWGTLWQIKRHLRLRTPEIFREPKWKMNRQWAR